MRKQEKISARQFGVMVILFSVGTPILIVPSGMASIAKQDAWIAALLGVGLGLLLTSLYIKVGNLNPEKSFLETIEHVLGKWIGKAVILVFVSFCLLTASEVLFFVGNFMTMQIMLITPIQSINIIFALVVVMAVWLGMETLVRSAEIFFPVFVFLFLIMVIFISPQIEIERIQPIMETKLRGLVGATLYFTSVFSFTPVLLLMIFPASIDRPQAASKAFYKGTLIGGAILVIVIALCIVVLGPDMTARQSFPSYALAKKITVGQFLQRIEIVMAFMWFITMFYRICMYFYGAASGLAQVFNLKDYRFMLLPLGMFMVTLSLIVHPNVLHGNDYNRDIWLPYVSTYGLFLPLLLLLVHSIRRLKKQQKE